MLPPGGYKSVPNWQANCPDFRTIDALAAAAAMRITPDLLQRSRKKSLHAFHNNFSVPHSNFPLYFFKVAILRFNTVLDINGTLRHCWRSPRALKMLPIDSPFNFTLDAMFAPNFRKRSLAKIKKFQKNFSVAIAFQKRKKIAT